MPTPLRPLSPHLDIYRWQIGNTLSIVHRVTGVALAAGLLVLCYWLLALANGVAAYERAVHVLASPVGLLALMGWTFAFLYHLLNGVRHLFWDVGKGFERTQRQASGWTVVIGAFLFTAAVWAIVWHTRLAA